MKMDAKQEAYLEVFCGLGLPMIIFMIFFLVATENGWLDDLKHSNMISNCVNIKVSR